MSIMAAVTSEDGMLVSGVFFLDEKLIKLLTPYCPIITAITNPVTAQQSTILIAIFAGTHMLSGHASY